MTDKLDQKFSSIYHSLMRSYNDTADFSSSITGGEREMFTKQLLERILPNMYRISSGSIIDCRGIETGQIDLTIELPYSISFPISEGENRLLLADTIGAAFEIKSSLDLQWEQAIHKIEEIKQLHRYKLEENEFAFGDILTIPSFIVSFTGPKNLDTIMNKFGSISPRNWPDCVYVIEQGLFYCKVPGKDYTIEVKGHPVKALFAFISCLYETLQGFANNKVHIEQYRSLLKA